MSPANIISAAAGPCKAAAQDDVAAARLWTESEKIAALCATPVEVPASFPESAQQAA